MASLYKQKLLGEINEVPESCCPDFIESYIRCAKELTNQLCSTRQEVHSREYGGRARLMNRLSPRPENPCFLMSTKKGNNEFRP